MGSIIYILNTMFEWIEYFLLVPMDCYEMGKLGNSNGVVRISSFFQNDPTIFGILCGQRRAGFSKIPLIYHHYFVLHQHNTNLENNSNPLGERDFRKR